MPTSLVVEFVVGVVVEFDAGLSSLLSRVVVGFDAGLLSLSSGLMPVCRRVCRRVVVGFDAGLSSGCPVEGFS